MSPSQLLAAQLEAIKQQLLSDVSREIEILEHKIFLPPELNQRELDNLFDRSLREVSRHEGILASMYRTLIDDSERQASAQEIANKKRDEIYARHQAACANHAKRIQERETKLSLLRVKRDDIPNEAKNKLDRFHAAALTSTPTKSKEVRLLRAHALGLVTTAHEQLARPEPTDEVHEELKRGIRRQDGYRCVCCGHDGLMAELHVHHIIPLYKFGTNDPVNLVTLCLACHRKVHRRDGVTVTRNRPVQRRPRQVPSRFVAADIETTGLSNNDEIIEIGAALFVDGVCKQTFQTFVQITRPLPTRITQLTGITSAMLQDASRPRDAFRSFRKFVGSDPLVFHNETFDMRFLRRYAEIYGQPFTGNVHCTLRISRNKLPDLSCRKLTSLVEHFRLRVNPTHRATDDSIAAGLVFIELSKIANPPPLPRRRRERGNRVQVPADSTITVDDAQGNARASPRYICPCPQCGQRLRVPVGKLLDITCPICRHCYRRLTSYKICFFFDWGGDCLWAGDDATKEHYGYPIAPTDLPLPAELVSQCVSMAQRWIALNGRTDSAFRIDAAKLVKQLQAALGKGFEVVDEYTSWV
jgi:DNA polymerase III epsilon subunit family exonuclease